ncbi:MAG: SCO family protein [Aquabacterium sp.]
MRVRSLPRRRQFMLAAASVFLLAACGQSETPSSTGSDAAKASFHAVDITGAAYARQLSLKDLDGRPRSLSEFKGKVVFVFFGFTQCPDVCPTTMAEIAEVRRRLGPDGDKVQAIFVTVDPERDTPEVLKAYLGNLDKDFVGLRGTREETDAMAREFKVFYQKVPTSGDQYTIDHTAGGYLFDPQGHVRLFVRYGMGVDKLTADIRQLLVSS